MPAHQLFQQRQPLHAREGSIPTTPTARRYPPVHPQLPNPPGYPLCRLDGVFPGIFTEKQKAVSGSLVNCLVPPP